MATWIVETDLNDAAERIAASARAQGAPVQRWSTGDAIPDPQGDVVFIGSLTECARMPGVLGDPERLRVDALPPALAPHRLNRETMHTTVGAVADLDLPWPRVFARPNSAMKPFAGRVLDRAQLSPGALDHGFYYDDLELPVVLSPAQPVEEEWRFASVDRRVVAHSGYAADGRSALAVSPPDDALALAETVAADSPEPTVVIDLCRLADGTIRLVELNLFSGSDFYACDTDAIVRAVEASFAAS